MKQTGEGSYERQALSDRLASISWEMARIYKEYLHYKSLQDAVLKRIVEIDGGNDE